MSTKLHDLNQAALYKSGLNPSTRGAGITNSQTGPALDMIEGDGICHLISTVGYFSGTGVPTFDCKVQESADGSTGWADITGAALSQITTQATTTPATAQIVQFQRTKRYLRLVSTVAGTTSPLYVGDVSVLEQKKNIYA